MHEYVRGLGEGGMEGWTWFLGSHMDGDDYMLREASLPGHV